MLKIDKQDKSSGAVSLFVVVFVALLITVVTVSFVRIMVQDQQQASSTDLSQSAYDSAQAGVEDGKRALLRYENACSSDPSSSACVQATAQINSSECNEALGGLEDVSIENGEVPIETGSSNNLDQAYTCVKINMDTEDYLGSLEADQSRVVPLDAGDTRFNRVRVEWFSVRDLSTQDGLDVDLQSSAESQNLLPPQNTWPGERPPIMRAQFMQVGESFRLSDFDASSGNTSRSNANTVFLYPAGQTGESSDTLQTVGIASTDIRQVPSGSPVPVTCSGNLSAGGYSCRVTLTLPNPVGGSSSTEKTAFLRLTSLYNKAHFRVSLYNGSTLVRLNAVQPEIDSTGRANDLFRRVQARVEMFNNRFPYPEAAVDLTNDFCKDFMVTQNTGDYTRNNSCQP